MLLRLFPLQKKKKTPTTTAQHEARGNTPHQDDDVCSRGGLAASPTRKPKQPQVNSKRRRTNEAGRRRSPGEKKQNIICNKKIVPRHQFEPGVLLHPACNFYGLKGCSDIHTEACMTSLDFYVRYCTIKAAHDSPL